MRGMWTRWRLIRRFWRWEALHPESPYQSTTVTAHNQDARAYIRYSQDKYDLIVYGLLDSHTLLSGVSSVRLDSYIYTVEAIRERGAFEARRDYLFELLHD